MLSFVGLNVATVCLWIVQASGFLAIPTTISGRDRYHHRGSEAFAHGGGVLGDAQEETYPDLKVLEFYSGIGGLRVSLQAVVEATRLETTAVGSYEINDVANSVYEHNFPGRTVTRRSIEHISPQELDGAADLWLLSPPCQPFCRIGKQMDETDNRSTSFLHLLSILKAAERPPAYFFLENVKGFEGSQTHTRLLKVLTERGFHVEQFMLSPVHLGIPNTRLRYYCLASRRGLEGEGKIAAIQESLPQQLIEDTSGTLDYTQQKHEGVPLRPLSEYLDTSLVGEAALPLLLSPKAASHANPLLRFDVVTLRSTETTTFTKGYGKHAGRAGPVILLTEDGERRVSEEELGRFPSGLDLGPDGRELRWFSDREMLRLHGFPVEFEFPASLTLRQRFGLVGNSVNVEVVALLLRRMLFQGHADGDESEEKGMAVDIPGYLAV